MSEDASEERSLFEPRAGGAVAYVTSELGVVRVDLGPDRIGEFSLVRQCRARAVGVDDGLTAVGTDETLLLDAGDGFESTDAGPVVATGVDEDTVFVAGPDGTVSRRVGGTETATAWEHVGSVGEPRQFDGRYLAAGDGVYEVGDGLARLDRRSAVDVTADGPRVATTDGILSHDQPDWEREHDQPVSALAGRYAADERGLLERTERGWHRIETASDETPVALADGSCLYAVTGDGRFLVSVPGEQATDGQGGWRSRGLGIRGVTGLAVRE